MCDVCHGQNILLLGVGRDFMDVSGVLTTMTRVPFERIMTVTT